MACLLNVVSMKYLTSKCSKASLPCEANLFQSFGNRYHSCQQKYLNRILMSKVNMSLVQGYGSRWGWLGSIPRDIIRAGSNPDLTY